MTETGINHIPVPVAGDPGMYSFRMVWRFKAPIERVWTMIQDPQPWPQWWKNCKNVEKLAGGDANGAGAMQRFTMQTQLPYPLSFVVTSTRIEEPEVLGGDVRGELEGKVLWRLSQDGEITTLRYDWDVRPTKPWMRLFSAFLRPVFKWNHRSMMRNGGRGLSRMIDAELVEQEYR